LSLAALTLEARSDVDALLLDYTSPESRRVRRDRRRRLRQPIPVLRDVRPDLGDRARLLALFDAALDLPRVRVDVSVQSYPRAEEALRCWADVHRRRVEPMTYEHGKRRGPRAARPQQRGQHADLRPARRGRAEGLDALDRRYLAIVAERPVGLEAICAELGEDKSTIEDAVEPFLMQTGLIKRGGKGRLATEAGREHLGHIRAAQPSINAALGALSRTKEMVS
jgi:hypothetical protein